MEQARAARQFRAGSPTVLRVLGRRDVSVSGKGKALKELSSDCRRYAEGLRVKHRLNGDSVKRSLGTEPRDRLFWSLLS